MTQYIIPTIGVKGFYRLKAPFDSLMIENESYTCQAIRNLGEYIANNEDPLTLIYTYYGLTEADYDLDRSENMYIVSLQSETGQWLYVPARYILSYPILNGVPYHNVMLGVGLGAIPVEADLAAIKTALSNVVYDMYGVTPQIEAVQLSKTLLVSRENHDRIENARQIRATQKMSDSGRLAMTQNQLSQALVKIQALEKFILDKHLV